jgi:hypothetical protein
VQMRNLLRARRNCCHGVGTNHSQAEFWCRAMLLARHAPPPYPPPYVGGVPCFSPLLPRPLMYGPRRRRSASGHKRLRRLPFGTDIDQPTLAPTGKLGSGSQTFGFVIVCFGLAKMKRPTDKTAPPDEKPPTARKPSRITKEILKVIEEYASSQREFLKALRKRLFH